MILSEERLLSFTQHYLDALTVYVVKHPEILEPIIIQGNIEVTVIPGKTVEQLAGIMINCVRVKGIHGVNLSPAMKTAAKKLGINPTYKALDAYLKGE